MMLPSVPLFWRVFVTNAAVLALAFIGLVLAPVRVSVPVAASEIAVLTVGLLGLLAVNLILLRPAFRPLDELAETMRRHDPLSPGVRAQVAGDPDVAALAQAFNEMLERLEFERRDSARSALMLQEAERRRVARELHDEVGQTLTGVMLQVEGLAAVIPADLHDQLDELRETVRHGIEEVRRIVRRLRPEALEELGLQSALAALATAIGDQARLVVQRRLQDTPGTHRRTRARRLSRRPGGADQCRAPRRGERGRAATGTRPRPDGAHRHRRRPRSRARIAALRERHPRDARAGDARSAPV